MGTNNFDLVTFSPKFDLFIENFNLANNLWTVNARALIFHMNIPSGKNFLYVQTCWSCDLDLRVWPFKKRTLTLLITFEQWVLELWFFTEEFHETRFLYGYQQFELCDIDLQVTFWKLNFLNNIWIVSTRALIFHMSISSNRTFLWHDLSPGIKIFVLVTWAISGIGHYRWHLRFTNTSCLLMGSA